jgi:proteasome lid subunit RPN8/RPN11
MTVGHAPKLEIAADIMAAIRLAAAQAYPNEGCGLLLGVEEPAREDAKVGVVLRVTRLVLAANLHPEPRKGFELDPAVLISVLRDLREMELKGSRSGERLLGHMHSHPDALARPSARDLAMAHEPGQVWLIVPVKEGRAGVPHAFQAVVDSGNAMAFRGLPINAPRAGGDHPSPPQSPKESP